MKTLLFCAYNMNNCCVELKFTDGSMIAIDTIAVENEVADNITREQMATIFYRYSEFKGYDLTAGSYSQFPDAGKVSKFAQTAKGWVVGNGLLLGMDDGTLCPTYNTTRAQVAAILNRFMENIVK